MRTAGLAIGFGILLGLQTGVARTVTQSAGGSSADGCQMDVVSFDKAHLAPGETLTSVSMTLGGSMDFTLVSSPDAEFPVPVSLSAGVMVNGPGIPDKPVCDTFSFDLLRTEHLDVDGVVSDGVSMGDADVSPTLDNAAYIGPGTVDVFVFSSTDDSCGIGLSLCSFDMSWGLSLDYVIAEGPRVVEPSSMSLLFGGGLGLIGLTWRRRALTKNGPATSPAIQLAARG